MPLPTTAKKGTTFNFEIVAVLDKDYPNAILVYYGEATEYNHKKRETFTLGSVPNQGITLKSKVQSLGQYTYIWKVEIVDSITSNLTKTEFQTYCKIFLDQYRSIEIERQILTLEDSKPYINPFIIFDVVVPDVPINQNPLISITSPISGVSIVAGTLITITAQASDSDGTVASVSFYANNILIGTDTTSPYFIPWTPTQGNYNLTARATDDKGAITTSAIIPVVVSASSTPTPTEPILRSEANLLGINIPAMGDYFAPYFRDAARQSRPYEAIGGGVIAKNANGYPTVANFQVYIWAGGYKRHGTYFIEILHSDSYSGEGILDRLGGELSNIIYDININKTTATWIHTNPDESVGMLIFQGFTGGITHLKVLRPSSSGSNIPYDESKIFMDSIVDIMGKFDGARFLDTTGVNSSSIRTWNQRTLITDYSQARDQGEPESGFGFAGRGLAWEYVADLANEVKAKYPSFKAIWINIPVLADNDYVLQLFTLLKTRLNTGIIVHCEFGNENWNYTRPFLHAEYNKNEAVLDAQKPGSLLVFDGNTGEYTLSWRRQALRTIEFYSIAQTVWGADVDNKIQFQLQWQQRNGQNTAGVMLSFVDKALNALDIIGKFGLGGSWYYNPIHNDPNLTIDNIWNSGTMNSETWANEWLQTDVDWVTAYSKPNGFLQWNGYEGGTSFDKVFESLETTKEVADKNNAIMKLANYDSRMTTNHVEHIDMGSKHGRNWNYCYKLGGARENQYEWAYLYNHDDFNTPKINAIDILRSRNRAALTYGRIVPFIINAGLYSINDKGYGDRIDGDYKLDGEETVSYTFRVVTAGNYTFSFVSNDTNSYKILFGTTVLNNNINALANQSIEPIIINCPNSGLYAIRIKNLSTGQAYLKEISIQV
jgi:hypothetical protein